MAFRYRIVVRCPETGRDIDRGMRTSGRETLNSRLMAAGTVQCPHCGQAHNLRENSFLDSIGTSHVNGLWRPNR